MVVDKTADSDEDLLARVQLEKKNKKEHEKLVQALAKAQQEAKDATAALGAAQTVPPKTPPISPLPTSRPPPKLKDPENFANLSALGSDFA